ncbi:MAG: hypothetical protein KGI67_04080 [Pseudomonadota bacterium]|nr:hypothetical protein [Pseudomonadota bacterium]
MSVRGLVLSLTVCACLDAGAARLGGGAPSLLMVDQLVSTDANGYVLQSWLQLALRSVASTASGLMVLPDAAGAAPDPGAAAAGLDGVQPLLWRDPPLQRAPQAGAALALSSAAYAAAANDTPAARVTQLSTLATRQLQSAAPAMAARLAAVARSRGAAEAWFNFRQQLPVAGAPRSVVWTLHATAAGTWFAGTPVVDAPGAALLHARYVPLTVAAGLPAGYGYQDGGWLRWDLSDALGHALPGAGARDTHGAFDGAQGLACLTGSASTPCDPAQEGIPGLMERLGVAQAELTVAASLRPVFVVTAAGQRYAVARLVVQRALSGADPACLTPPWQFRNDYQAAFQLDARLDRYRRAADGHWSLLERRSLRQAGPLLPWKSVRMTLPAAPLPALDALAIDPEQGGLVRLDAFPAGLQRVTAGAVVCEATATP